MSENNSIEAALLALSGMDADMARFQNGVGFNGRDTNFGNSLAQQLRAGRSLSARQRAAAYKMLRTYKVQLLRDHGVDYDQIPTPGAPPPREELHGEIGLAGTSVATVTFTPYDPDVVGKLKSLRGRWDPVRRRWTVPMNLLTVEVLATLPPGIRATAPFLAQADQLLALATENRETSSLEDAEIEVPGLGGELRPFQKAGVAYASRVGSTFIADEMGLGKTVQALATLEARAAYPAVIVVPAVVKINWQREATKWLPRRSVEVVGGRKPYAQFADVVVINYDVLSYWKDELIARGYRAVVFDESHYLKNGKAGRTKAAKALAGKVDLRLMLTGTPVLNRPVELVSQLDILGHLPSFGGFWTFVKRYCGAYQASFGWDMSGATHLDELHDRLRATCYVRRTKEQVLTELPPKQRATIPVPMADVKRYAKVEIELRAWLKERIRADEELMEILASLDPSDPDAMVELEARDRERGMGRAKVMVMIEALKQVAAEEKLAAVKEWVSDFLDSGNKLVVFAHHQNIVRELAAAFGAPSITGATSPQARQDAVDRFQSDPDCRVIICNLQAAGVGITLTAASDVAFVELPWRPGDLDQAEDRCHRIGQTDSVTAWYLLAEGTIEEEIAGLLDAKRLVVSAATDGKAPGKDSSIMGQLLSRLTKEEDD